MWTRCIRIYKEYVFSKNILKNQEKFHRKGWLELRGEKQGTQWYHILKFQYQKQKGRNEKKTFFK